MKVALVMEYSQAPKNALVIKELADVAKSYGHETVNYGQYNAEDQHLTYNEVGLITALLLNSGAADFVITGCGTGMGAMVAANSFPGVVCGHAQDPADAYLFTQVNGGNALSFPYAKGFGWGGELNLRYMFEKVFLQAPGSGYPPENAASEQRNAGILNELKKVTHKDMVSILDEIDPELLEHVLRRPSFREQFMADCKCPDLKAAVQKHIEKLGLA